MVSYWRFGTAFQSHLQRSSSLLFCKWDNNLEREMDCLTLEDWTDRLCLNVGNYQSMLRNILEERRSHLHQGGKPEITHLGDVIFNKLKPIGTFNCILLLIWLNFFLYLSKFIKTARPIWKSPCSIGTFCICFSRSQWPCGVRSFEHWDGVPNLTCGLYVKMYTKGLKKTKLQSLLCREFLFWFSCIHGTWYTSDLHVVSINI